MSEVMTVLHVGPVNTRGGMASVIRLLSESPPDGWKAETLATHVEGSNLAKLLCWRKARKALIRRLKSNSPDLVQIHTASDYSWWRKKRVALLARKAGVKVVIHIHSGRFDEFCRMGAGNEVKKICSMDGIEVVTLSQVWHDRLEEWVGDSTIMHNPVDPDIRMEDVERKKNQILFMGRDDPIKNAGLAIKAVEMARKTNPELQLMMTGIDSSHALAAPYSGQGWLNALGWVSEVKKRLLLNESAMLLVPSQFECQPMVVLEAQACGLPVLGSAAVAEVVSNVNIVESLNIDGWSNAIKSAEFNEQVIEKPLSVMQDEWLKLYSSLK
jgi:glycosyltransferase involved in cell wall biosynthesis